MFLPADLRPRSFLLPHALSYSELSTLSNCEMKWSLIYDTEDRPEHTATPQMELGSEMHGYLNSFHMHDTWGGQDVSETANYLMDRYMQHYATEPTIQVLEVNVPFAVKAWDVWIFGWFDGLCRDENGDLWIVEFKTMGNWSRLHQLPKDKQISLYIYAARKMGYDVKGVMFDAINTTHWKTEEGEVYKSGPRKGQPKDYHAAADSFQRRWVERSEEDLEEFMNEMWSALARRGDLSKDIFSPVRNIGQSCSWCSCMAKCYDIEIELTDAVLDDTLYL